MTLPEIDLPKLAGAAGSAVGLIISTAILLSWQTARYVPAFDRYRALVGEVRAGKAEPRRRELLEVQVRDYRTRLLIINRAACLLVWVMWCCVATILTAGLTFALPGLRWLAAGGAVTLFAALALDAVAVGFMLTENRIDRRAIVAEAADLDAVSETNEGEP